MTSLQSQAFPFNLFPFPTLTVTVISIIMIAVLSSCAVSQSPQDEVSLIGDWHNRAVICSDNVTGIVGFTIQPDGSVIHYIRNGATYSINGRYELSDAGEQIVFTNESGINQVAIIVRYSEDEIELSDPNRLTTPYRFVRTSSINACVPPTLGVSPGVGGLLTPTPD